MVEAGVEAAGGAAGGRVPTLAMRGVSKTFPGVKALNDVQLKAWGGEVLALMGENGAGKSTLMKILSGAYQADAGRRDPDRRPAGGDQRPDRGQAARHRDHLPGAEPGAEPERGREHLSGRRDPSRGIDRPQGDVRRLPAGAGAAGRAVHARDHGRHALDRRAAAGRDRPRPARQVARSWCSTSRPPPCPRARPSACSRWSASCAARASR